MLDSLPNHLSDRIRMVNDYHEISNDGPVVVWLKSSLRVHENPAIDTGILLAERYQKSLLIYQAIDERYPMLHCGIITCYWMELVTLTAVVSLEVYAMYYTLLEKITDKRWLKP